MSHLRVEFRKASIAPGSFQFLLHVGSVEESAAPWLIVLESVGVRLPRFQRELAYALEPFLLVGFPSTLAPLAALFYDHGSQMSLKWGS